MLPFDRREVFRYAVWSLGASISLVLAALTGTAVVAPLDRRESDEWLDVVPADQLGDSPRSFAVNHAARQGWHEMSVQQVFYAFRTAEGKPLVLSSVCSHLGCSVRWGDQERRFFCPCHGGVYDLDGAVLAGPPSRPLERPEIKIETGMVRIKRT